MFDIGFSELMVIAVVALIVIGPEKLPKVARTVGHLFGRMQRYVNDVKADISREMALDDLRKLQASMQETAQSLEQSVNESVRSAENEVNRIAADVQPAAEAPDVKDPARPA
jgi:sec-independent protein translocase protein TatB